MASALPSRQRLALLLWVGAWYVASFVGIVLNKNLVGIGHASTVEPWTLALVQTVCTVFLSAIVQSRRVAKSGPSAHPTSKWMPLMGLGCLRSLCIILGLVSLQHVAASFTETVKASSPLFTVVAAFVLNGERTEPGALIGLTLVTGGLVYTSAREASFTMIGFTAALSTNFVECIQNVFCKRLMRTGKTDRPVFTNTELQYYSALAALLVQFPLCVFFWSWRGCSLFHVEASVIAGLLLNGFIYWVQSALAFKIMDIYDPVTVSVFNTVKRALIICLSAKYFGNVITPTAAFGTAVTLAGGALYSLMKNKKIPILAASKEPGRTAPPTERHALPSGQAFAETKRPATCAGRTRNWRIMLCVVGSLRSANFLAEGNRPWSLRGSQSLRSEARATGARPAQIPISLPFQRAVLDVRQPHLRGCDRVRAASRRRRYASQISPAPSSEIFSLAFLFTDGEDSALQLNTDDVRA